jgi:hypothetical protein
LETALAAKPQKNKRGKPGDLKPLIAKNQHKQLSLYPGC